MTTTCQLCIEALFLIVMNLIYVVLTRLTCVIGSHGLLKQGNPDYDDKREELYKYYHPLEYSPTISIEEKTKLMEEWYVY